MSDVFEWLPWRQKPTQREMNERTQAIVLEIEKVTTKIKSNADRAIELLERTERRNARRTS